jgi:hypothetical protein
MQALRAIVIAFLLVAVNADAARACCTPGQAACAADCVVASGCAACPAVPADTNAVGGVVGAPRRAAPRFDAMVPGETPAPEPPPPRGRP